MPVYKDQWIKLIGSVFFAHLLVTMGWEASWESLLKEPLYFRNMFFATGMIGLIWEMIRRASKQLDHHLPWHLYFFPRSCFQVLLGLVVPLLSGGGWVYMVWVFIHQSLPGWSSFPAEVWATTLIAVGINAFYATFFFIYQSQAGKYLVRQYQEAAEEPGFRWSQHIRSHREASVRVPLPVKGMEEIAYCEKAEKGWTWVLKNGNCLQPGPLSGDETAYLNDPQAFFALTPHTYLHRQAIQAFCELPDGRLELCLQEDHVMIVPDFQILPFKSWISHS